jgi:hypothetical protein
MLEKYPSQVSAFSLVLTLALFYIAMRYIGACEILYLN